MTINAPNLLTLGRIFLVPLLVVVLLTPVSEDWFGVGRYALAIVIFLVASLTDFLDGYLARRNNQISKFGILFDPIADKLLISAALITLVEKHLAPAWAVVIIIGREFAVTGLRSVAASEGVIISAQKVGKIKMWAQCVAVVALLVAAANGNPPVSNFGWSIPTFRFWEVPEVHEAIVNIIGLSPTTNDWRVLGYTVGRGALWIAVVTSIWSMLDYFKLFFNESRQRSGFSVIKT